MFTVRYELDLSIIQINFRPCWVKDVGAKVLRKLFSL